MPASAAGAYVSSVFERLGIAEAMKTKTVPQTSTGEIAKAVAKGDAEIGVFLINVLMAPGVELAGPFPAELQNDLVFTAAVAADTKEAEAAKAFIAYLQTPAATAIIKSKGMNPANPMSLRLTGRPSIQNLRLKLTAAAYWITCNRG